MSLTSYRAAPPRVEVIGGFSAEVNVLRVESLCLDFAGLAATYSPAS